MGQHSRAAKVLQSSLVCLPDDALEHISRFAIVGKRSAAELRNVATWWCEPAARLIKRLAAHGCLLPSIAWTVFPKATGLIIILEGVPEDEVSNRLSELSQTLPEHLEHFTLRRPTSYDSDDFGFWTPLSSQQNKLSKQLNSLGDQLSTSACSSALKVVIIHAIIPPAAADALLRGLPCLEQTKLSIAYAEMSSSSLFPSAARDPSPNSEHYTISSFPPTLQDLQLQASNHYRNKQLRIDAVALAACSHLQRVHLNLFSTPLLNPTSISSCKALNTFEFDAPSALERQLLPTVITAALQLQQLQALKLEAAVFRCSSKEWEDLASLPNLHTLHAYCLVIDTAAAAPAHNITHLHLENLRLAPELVAADAPAGSVAQLLPAAQELHIEDSMRCTTTGSPDVSFGWLLHLLQGHLQLQVLVLSEDSYGAQATSRPFLQHYLSSFPKLRTASFFNITTTPADDILRAAAQSTTLQELLLSKALRAPRNEGATAAGLRALAGGACRQTLHKVDLEELLSGAHQLAVLLNGSMPAMREVSAVLCLPREQAAGALQLVQRQLEEGGVKGCVGLRETISQSEGVVVEGNVGGCQLRLTLDQY